MSVNSEFFIRNARQVETLAELYRAPRSADLLVDVAAIRITNPERDDASLAHQTASLARIVNKSRPGGEIDFFTNPTPASNEFNFWNTFLNQHDRTPLDTTRIGELHVSGLPLDQPVTRDTMHGSLDQLAGWVAGYQLLATRLFYQPLSVLRARTATIAEHHLKKWGFTTYPSGYPNETIVDRPDLLPALARDPGLATDLQRTQELRKLLEKPVIVGLMTPSKYLKDHNTSYTLDDLTMRAGSTTLAIDVDTTPHQAVLKISHTDTEEIPGQDDVVRGALIRIGARLPLVGMDTVVTITDTHPLIQSAKNIANYGTRNQEIYVPTMAFAHAIGTDIKPNPPLSDYAIANILQKFT
ncbi:MAG: hypothetical protein AAB800_02840 [Patescibacteria group bacterium]